MDASISIFAAKLSKDHKIPMADSIILATARKYNAILWTQDDDFIGLDGVKYFPKK
ncbi:toxin-antitoxin system, toxin component, PIN family [Leptospira licerasiae str. MMD4847]|uniref:Toxin-antitoxin system, toxin component, PIN family n=1 Tax=Leptospira licerasiae str. MMD4847 TaxID=1049971 RepID=A0ABP2RJE4_9LEPT|nr:toxin-antitoxin system, toxin component, PIN family [Leptospira licerasiae str. MMD4847]